MATASSSDGYNVIPASRRPDGTWRKEIKVKSGYVPPDEVAKYESSGKRFVNEKPTLPPGYTPPAESEAKKLTKNQKKNERKKQQRREKAAETIETSFQKDTSTKSVEKTLTDLRLSSDTATSTSKSSDSSGTKTNPALLKQIRAARKKVKQCEQIEERKSKGEVLEKEQIEKLSKRQEFEEELQRLEAQLDS